MKQLFFFLFFLNIVYFFWGVTAGEKKITMNHPVPLYKESKLEKLMLISKDEMPQVIAKQLLLEREEKERTLRTQSECYRVGDFVNARGANKLSKALSSIVEKVLVIRSEAYEEFWVIYPSNGDWNRSLLNVTQLKANGVTDLWLVPNGPYKGVISLGLFITTDGTNNRLNELSDKLVEAEVIIREKYRYSVKLITNSGIEPIQSYLDGLKTDEKSSIRKIAC